MPELLPVAVFGVDIIIVALMLFLIYFAALPLLRATGEGIAALAEKVPGGGDILAQGIRSGFDWIAGHVTSFMEDTIRAGTGPLWQWVDFHANYRRFEMYSNRNVAQNVVGAVAQLAAAQRSEVTPAVTDTINHTVITNTNQTNEYITQVNGVTQAYVDTAYQQLAGWANDAIQSVYQDVVGTENGLSNLRSWVEGAVQNALDTAQADADRAQTTAYTAATAYAKEAADTVFHDLTTATDTLDKRITDTQSWTETYVGEQTHALRDTLESDLGKTAAIAVAVTSAFADFMKNCGDDVCGGLPNFAKGMSSLQGLLSLTLMAGFLLEVIENPEQTAEVTVGVADALEAAPKAVLHDVFGV